LASNAFYRFSMFFKSWRSQPQRSPAWKIKTLCFFNSLAGSHMAPPVFGNRQIDDRLFRRCFDPILQIWLTS
jgi:hypothetical protein